MELNAEITEGSAQVNGLCCNRSVIEILAAIRWQARSLYTSVVTNDRVFNLEKMPRESWSLIIICYESGDVRG